MKRAAAVLAVLAVGFAGYWFLIRDNSEPAKTETAEAKSTTPEKPARGDRDRGDGQDRQREATVLFDDDPKGTLRLEGQVLDSADDGVAGAIVSINSNPPRSVRTDEDGSFGFDELVGRNYRVVARHADGVAGPITAKLTDTNDPVIMRLRAAGKVTVTVVSAAGGKPVRGATVELRGIDRQTESTGDEGTVDFVSVVPSRYEVVAYADGFAKKHTRVRVSRTGGATSVRLSLVAGAAVSGVVVDDAGKPVQGARVIYSGASDWSQQASGRWDAVETDAAGKFAFKALPAGTFRFVARADRRAPGSSEMITLDGQSAIDNLRIQMEAGATIRGVVTSSAGNPVAAARVRVRLSGRGRFRGRGTSREAFADDKGAYEIEGLSRKALALVAVGPEASSQNIDIDMSEAPFERTVDITLDVEGLIAGIVVDSEGEPIEGASVSAFPDFRKNRRAARSAMRLRGMPRALTDAGGRFKLTGIEDGEYSVRATRSNVGRRQAWLVEPIEAKSGDTELRIELPADGVLKGKVAFADGEAPGAFNVNLSGWGGGTPFSTQDGSFEIPDMAPQKYTVTIRGVGFDSKQLLDVQVKAGEELDLGTITVSEGRKIVGRVLSPSGQPVPEALVRAGRAIFGSGSSSTSGGRGGPPMAQRTKDARTDENGEFGIYGLSTGDVSIVAEHEVEGRSQGLLIQNGGQSVKDLEIRLAAYGSLEGKVTRGGKPMSGTRVGASSTESPDVTFGVAAGEDGTFRFDRLAPGTYKVSAVIGNPMMGMGFHATTVTVESGKTAEANLAVEAGELELSIAITESAQKELNFTWVTAAVGKLTAANARELQLAIAKTPDGFSAQTFSIAGGDAKLRELMAGEYTICATPYPPEVKGMSETMAYMERVGDSLAVFCTTQTLADSPKEQSAALTVTAPPFIPPPSDT